MWGEGSNLRPSHRSHCATVGTPETDPPKESPGTSLAQTSPISGTHCTRDQLDQRRLVRGWESRGASKSHRVRREFRRHSDPLQTKASCKTCRGQWLHSWESSFSVAGYSTQEDPLLSQETPLGCILENWKIFKADRLKMEKLKNSTITLPGLSVS